MAIKQTAEAISEIDTGVLQSVSPGTYHYETENGVYLIVSPDKAGVPVGAYPVINCKNKVVQRHVTLGVMNFGIISICNEAVFFVTTV